MIGRALGTLVLLALVVPTAAHAQLGPVRSVSVGAGFVSPSGSFGENEKIGWHLLLSARARIKRVNLALDGVYARVAHDGGVDGSSMLSGGLLNVVLPLRSEASRLRPFLLAGIGAMRVNIDVPGFGSAAVTKRALDFGGGVEIGGGADGTGRRWFVAARLVTVATSPQSTAFIPLTAGVILPVGRR